jgi:hypothetical protein
MNGSQNGRRRVTMTVLCLLLSGLALLLWARLKLVTGAPRTAYAVPTAAEHAPKPAPR